MSDVLVSVDNVSKKFCRSLKKSLWYGLHDMAGELFGSVSERELRPDEFWAVKNVSFELRRGECLGLIGRNGAGKTSLLRLLNGLIKPDRGRIEMRGRIGALISLGAGFNPILTGRENIYVNASVLGLSKSEIDDKMEDIIEFSEIGEFIDTPVQNYSSGMQVRLGFSVATALHPDILILDEVLAVGDVNFQIKCGHRIRLLASEAAVIFVSHSMQFVSWFCSRALVLNNGTVIHDAANTADGIGTYLSMIETKQEISGTGEATIVEFRLRSGNGIVLPVNMTLNHGEHIIVELDIVICSPRRGVQIRLSILDESSNGIIYLPVQDRTGAESVFSADKFKVSIDLGRLELNAGNYNFLVAITDADSKSVLLRQQGICPFRVSGTANTYAKIVRPVSASLIS